jgi:gluconate 2-dehydrogenase gamma chain
MAGQGVERREALRIIGLASIAGTFPGFRRWAFACGHEGPQSEESPQAVGAYKPQFFTPQQFQLVERLTDLIIPSEDGPGAKDAGVAEFVDFMVANNAGIPNNQWQFESSPDPARTGPRDIRSEFRSGLNWIDAWCQSSYAQPFLQCSADQQNNLLNELAYKKRYQPSSEEGRAFFLLIREYTVMGFYTSRIGLENLDFPGLKTMWAKLPGCPHPDDPEHIRLPKKN